MKSWLCYIQLNYVRHIYLYHEHEIQLKEERGWYKWVNINFRENFSKVCLNNIMQADDWMHSFHSKDSKISWADLFWVILPLHPRWLPDGVSKGGRVGRRGKGAEEKRGLFLSFSCTEERPVLPASPLGGGPSLHVPSPTYTLAETLSNRLLPDPSSSECQCFPPNCQPSICCLLMN